MKNTTGIYLGGIPTEPDLKKLMDKFGNAPEGATIAHDDIASAINTEYGSQRYRTIVNKFTDRMFRERNIVLMSHKGHGYLVANNRDRVIVGGKKFKTGRRFLIKAGDIVGMTDVTGLDKVELSQVDFYQRQCAMLRQNELTKAKEIRQLIKGTAR